MGTVAQRPQKSESVTVLAETLETAKTNEKMPAMKLVMPIGISEAHKTIKIQS